MTLGTSSSPYSARRGLWPGRWGALGDERHLLSLTLPVLQTSDKETPGKSIGAPVVDPDLGVALPSSRQNPVQHAEKDIDAS
jgi:hypothetical protein